MPKRLTKNEEETKTSMTYEELKTVSERYANLVSTWNDRIIEEIEAKKNKIRELKDNISIEADDIINGDIMDIVTGRNPDISQLEKDIAMLENFKGKGTKEIHRPVNAETVAEVFTATITPLIDKQYELAYKYLETAHEFIEASKMLHANEEKIREIKADFDINIKRFLNISDNSITAVVNYPRGSQNICNIINCLSDNKIDDLYGKFHTIDEIRNNPHGEYTN